MLLQVCTRLCKGDRRSHSALLLFVEAIPLGVLRVNSSCLQREGGRDTHKGCRYCYDTGGKNRGRGFSGALVGPNRRRQSGGRYAGEAPVKEGRDHYTI